VPANSVQQYVKSALDGLAIPGPAGWELTAVVSDPVLHDVAMSPIAYIWAARGHKERRAMPRPIGLHKWRWDISVAIIAVMEIDDPNLDTAFPLVLQMIDGTLSTTPVPVIITDPITGFKSSALDLGEVQDMDYARMITTGTEGQALIRFGADLTLQLKEDISYMQGQVA
jgi:hypothetical protein